MTASNGKILIAGAGMGGLALAIALQRIGKSVSVFEAAPELAEIGAGLSLGPNAVHALNYIGLEKFLSDSADQPFDSVLRHFKTGEVLSRNALGDSFKEEFGAEYYQIHRADMHAGLVAKLREYDADSIKLGYRLTDFEQDENSVTAKFSNGESVVGAALIGADGIRSTLRSKLETEVEPRFTGQVAYRATLDSRGLDKYFEIADSSVTVGPGHIFVFYPIRHSALVNVVAITKSDAWKEEGWNTPASREEVLAEHEGWNDDVTGIISSAPEDAFYKWALFDREPLDTWTRGRVTLLGDAAHPMLPFLGMGAAMAFEDAIVLARCLEANDHHDDAFAMYKNARHERTTQVLLDSRNHGQVMQGSDPDKVDWKNMKSGNDWTYFSYNPVSIAI